MNNGSSILADLSNSGVLTITINRPEKLNALNFETVESLIACFKKIDSDSSIKTAILRGAGQKAFSVGADLKELTSFSEDEKLEFFKKLGELFKIGCALRKPLIAQVSGYALAGGCGLAALADIIVSDKSGIFGLPELERGIAPAIILAPLSKILSEKTLNYLALSASKIDAEEARQIGLVSILCEHKDLAGTTCQLAEKIASFKHEAVTKAKDFLRQVKKMSIESYIDFAVKSISDLAQTSSNLKNF
ncbi:MAG TPA: enoyl-CoA hydratase/isomerase family protein [Oligoflexia bacterium]|nr:enoyl-CoA hydratase/isomerase family protein [Oligoflexia bacterium]HMP26816.1 enoyl-CoA hydratase/isomerase family protein [Oligoflexia bacterium]